jgi:hypothetical protein
MAYFVFDLDETLAELYSAYYFVATLKIKQSLNGFMAAIFPDELEKQLTTAYHLFVERVLKEEQSDKPLGILRPGILKVMENIAKLKKKGKVANVIIYSNNSHLESLEFIRDLIHQHTRSKKLISDCIHWEHPIRAKEKILYPGMYAKTWNTLSEIIMQGKTSRLVMAKDVYFFDDLDHIDLQRTLHSNYYKVPGYTFKASVDRLNAIYDSVLRDANVNIIQLAMYMVDIFPIKRSLLPAYPSEITRYHLYHIFSDLTKRTVSENTIPQEDHGIQLMNHAIERVKSDTFRMKYRKRYTFKVKRSTMKK